MISLKGKRGLVLGIANANSIAYGCAKAFHDAGAELAITYLNERAEPHVRPLAEQMNAPIMMPCDVTKDGQLNRVIKKIRAEWGTLDFAVHAIAYAPLEDLHGRVVDCSADGFAFAMMVSVHSFIRLAHLTENLMRDGGSLVTMTYYGSEKVVTNYNVMGPVKAALESSVRYMAVELGEKRIRVNAVSPGPMRTRAASGIKQFDDLLDQAAAHAPLHSLVDLDDVGNLTMFLVSDLAKAITGEVCYVDAGYHIRD